MTDAAATTITQRTARRSLAGMLGGLGFVGTAEDGVATQDTNLLVDASADGLLDESYPTTRFQNAWLLLAHAPATAELEEHRRHSFSPSEGSMGIGRTFASTPVSGTTEFEVHTHGLEPLKLNDCIAEAMALLHSDVFYVLPGLLPDGDMESTGVTDWTGVNATRVKTAGKLVVTDTAADGYVESDEIAVDENAGYAIYGRALPSAGVASIVVYDVDNAAELEIAWHDEEAIDSAKLGKANYLLGTITTPEGCTSVQIRLKNTTNGAVTQWDKCGFLELDAYLPLPSWMRPERDLVGKGLYSMDTRGKREALIGLPRPDGGEWSVLGSDVPGIPLLHAARALGTFADDTDTIDEKWSGPILKGAKVFAYDRLAQTRPNDAAYYQLKLREARTDWLDARMTTHPVGRFGRPRWSDA